MRTLIAGAYLVYMVKAEIVGHIDFLPGLLVACGVLICIWQDLAELKRNLKE